MDYSENVRVRVLEVQVSAAMGGHDLGPFEETSGENNRGWEAVCRKCKRTVWVGVKGTVYSLLEDECGEK